MQEATMATMERAVGAANWEAALSAVERNAGAPGPDGMKAGELRGHLAKHGEGIKAKLLKGSFKPSAARRKEIPKPNGGTRPLSIPNVLDRFVQQLLLQEMQPLFEPTFSESSYGFRPGRSAHGAIEATQRHAREGRQWVVDMDITKFFDHVNHDILMTQVGRVVKDKRMLRLIGSFLRAGIVLPDGCKVSTEEGTPQGGPLSPLLANIYLDKLDKELERRGLKHVRYADDCNIYVSSERAAKRVLEVISQWIRRHLKLEVNAEKSGTGRVWERKFLGFILSIALFIAVSPQAIAKFKDQVRSKWDARQSVSSKQLRDAWSNYQRGWWAYYGRAEERRSILKLSGWIRRHIRSCFWQRWHSASGRKAALARLGIPPSRRDIAHCSRGAWPMGQHPVMKEALSNRVLKRHGFITPSDLAG
jgi:RNA-directed DNA polymerase